MSYGGGLDFSFGSGGTAFTSTTNQFEAGGFAPTASVLQPDGKIVVVGVGDSYAFGSGGGGFKVGFLADRYNPDGTRDANFNDTTLFSNAALTATGFSSLISSTPASVSDRGVALQADGKILVAGEVNGVAKVVRLDADGTLDASFGTGGIATLGTAATNDGRLDYASSVAVLTGGLIAVGGATTPTAGHDSPSAEMLNADGSVDASYGTNGLAVAPLPSNAQAFAPVAPVLASGSQAYTGAGYVGLVAEANGQVIVAANAALVAGGSSPTEVVATRFTAAGALDPMFGTAGQATVAPQSILPDVGSDSVTAIALQPDGKLIVGGTTFVQGSLPRLTVLRLGSGGTPDPTFGIGGINILGGVTPFGSSPGAIAVQPDGRVVLVDQFQSDYERLDADGLPDPEFGVDGTSVIYDHPLQIDGFEPGAVGVSIQPDGKLLVVGGIGLARLLGHGAMNDFGNTGVSKPAIYITSTATFAYAGAAGGAGELIPYGAPGVGQTLPAPGAYDRFGVTELAVYLPSLGEFSVRQFYGAPYQPTAYGGADVVTKFGMPGVGNSLPAPGDYDGSGRAELAVYLPSLGVYAYRPAAGGNDVYLTIGTPGAGQSTPVPADYFGTGRDDVAVYEPTTASFAIRNPATGAIATIPFGTPGAGRSIPVPGDYDGSGHAELAVYLPAYDAFIYRPAGGGADVVVPFGVAGAGNTLPAPGDYDGSGKTEVAAYLPGPGIFAYRPAGGGRTCT